MNDQRLSILILSAAGMATTFMPWVKLPVLGHMMGTDYNGWLTFAIYLVIFIFAFIGDRTANLSKIRLYPVIVLSFLAAGIGVWKILDLDGPVATVEYGLYLMVLIGVVIPLAVFIMKKGGTDSRSTKDPNNFTHTTEFDQTGAPD